MKEDVSVTTGKAETLALLNHLIVPPNYAILPPEDGTNTMVLDERHLFCPLHSEGKDNSTRVNVGEVDI